MPRHGLLRSVVGHPVKVKESSMRRWLTLISVLSLVVLGTGLISGRVAAQEDPMATPGAEAAAARVVPAEECQVEPRPAEEVFALLGLAEGADAATPAADRTPVSAPPWVAADPETVDAATATIRDWLACINADDNFRSAALMTDPAIFRFVGGGLAPDDAIEGPRGDVTGTPVPRREEELVRLLAVPADARRGDGHRPRLAGLHQRRRQLPNRRAYDRPGDLPLLRWGTGA